MIIRDYYKEAVELFLSLEYSGLEDKIYLQHDDKIHETSLERFIEEFDSFISFESVPDWCDREWMEDKILFIGSFISDLILLKIIKVE